MSKENKIALLSSWKNDRLDMIMENMPSIDDFRKRGPSFNWKDIEGDTRSQSLSPFSQLAHAVDMEAIDNADSVLLVLPCGKNAHMEAGYALAKGKPLFILLDDEASPETNYAGAAGIFTTVEEFEGYYMQYVNHLAGQKL